MNRLHPGARWVFRLRGYFSIGIIGLFLYVWFLSGVVGYIVKYLLGESFIIVAVSYVIIYILFVISVSEIYARMAYNRWLYEITNDGIKIEQGVIWKKYTSIPYERVQNVDINRGILARIFGFSTVEIETAGQSGRTYQGFRLRGWQRYKSEGHLPAIDIDNAEKIRAFVMKKIKQTSGTGL